MKSLWPIFLLSLSASYALELKNQGVVGNPLAHAKPCKGNDDILASFESGLPPGEENQYTLFVKVKDYVIIKNSQVNLKFDSDATLTLIHPDKARISAYPNLGYFNVMFFKKASILPIQVKGPATGTIPYPTSIVLNQDELCENPDTGYFDGLIIGTQDTAELALSSPEDSCGRKKVKHTELIANGDPTRPGDWPWHAALFRLDGLQSKYICGGTLISKTVILTAAHCTTIRGSPVIPKSLNVVLGKHNIFGGDIAAQEKEVFEVIVHQNFDPKTLDNDISLLKLSSEVVFTDYVQPACLWHVNDYKKLPSGRVSGTVVGWGINSRDNFATILHQVTLPKRSPAECYKSNAFFTHKLNDYKFCAGYTNGTSPCNGDSGGGYMVFVPDVPGDRNPNATGTWNLHGIVSLSLRRRDVALCDPYQYVLFTEVYKYKDWVTKYLS